LGSLMGGGMASLLEVGRTLDRSDDAVNLAYREGEKEYLYALNIGQQLLLMLLIDRQAYSSRLGSVWYYARQTAVNLREVLSKNEAAPLEIFLEKEIDQAFADELDKLFATDDIKPWPAALNVAAPAGKPPAGKPPVGKPPASELPAAPNPEPKPVTERPLRQPPQTPPPAAPEQEAKPPAAGKPLISFEEAVARQLISKNLWRNDA
jgi:hypothetical protein